jgi:hypothetical protein
MKKKKRVIYLLLVNLTDLSLCDFCKYAEFNGSCYDAELECHFFVSEIAENPDTNGGWLGGDCWGFRPYTILEDIVDVVGIRLQGLYVDWNSVPRIY